MRPLQAAVADSWCVDERSHVLYVLGDQTVKKVDVTVPKAAEVEILVDILRPSI